ncbi:MAG: B12-binding domain-containing protein [Thermoanaerobaculia bacterium]
MVTEDTKEPKGGTGGPVATPPGYGLAGPLLMALLAGDELGVKAAFEEARRRGACLALLARDVIGPAFDELGRMWRAGDVSVAEEHLATALVTRAFAGMAAPLPAPGLGAPRLVLSCLAGEFHELGVRIVAEVARSAGWQSEVLGANTPREAAIEYLAVHRPAAVGLSLALAAHLAECSRTVQEIRRASPSTRILVGGYAFRHDCALCGLTGADACFSDVVGLRDWLVANRNAAQRRCHAPHVEASCAAVSSALKKKIFAER